MYYKHITIVSYDSIIISKFGASLTDDSKVIIYNHQMFIVQATSVFLTGSHFQPSLIFSGKARDLYYKTYYGRNVQISVLS